MQNQARTVAWSGIAVIVALIVVGVVSGGIARHVVQSAPIWICVVLGLRGSGAAKWAAFPVFTFWFLIFLLIWLYLLGLAHVVGGHFGTIEIAMTILGGLACATGFASALRTRSAMPWWGALLVLFFVSHLQLAAMWLSLSTPVASDARLNAWLKR